MSSDVEILRAAVEHHLPRHSWPAWPGGWKGQVEAALIDAVLSIRSSYGSESTGVRGAVTRYRDDRGGAVLDDLTVLAGYDAARLADVLRNRQLTAGTPKAAAIVAAAQNLTEAGVRHAADLDATNDDHRRAYCSVHGLGHVTWSYFTMLLGTPGVKADTWVVRFVSEAMRRQVDAKETARLVTAVAEQMSESPTDLDHAIWRHARGR